MDNRQDLVLPVLQKELVDMIASKCHATSTVLQFSQTSRHFNAFFKNHPAKKIFGQLLHHTANGERDAAKAIWMADPDLLRLQGSVVQTGRYTFFNVTPYQIALMNLDNQIYGEMDKHLTTEEKIKQTNEIFPDGVVVKYDWNIEEAKKRLNVLTDAIIQDVTIIEGNLDTMNQNTRDALQSFCDYIKPEPNKKITRGLVFDMNFYIYILAEYCSHYEKFKNYHQRTFYCVRVRGLAEMLFPTGCLRRAGQGIDNALVRDTPHGICALVDDTPLLPINLASPALLGKHSFIQPWGAAGHFVRVRLPPPKTFHWVLFIERQYELCKVYLALDKPGCVIC